MRHGAPPADESRHLGAKRQDGGLELHDVKICRANAMASPEFADTKKAPASGRGQSFIL
jgi:hypothetical protein